MISVVRYTNNFRLFANQLDAVAQQINKETAAELMAEMRRRAPVRTGYLRDSISVIGLRNGILVDVGAPYAAHVNYGTYKQPARPFFEPAVDAVRPAWIARWSRFGDYLPTTTSRA